MPKKTKKENTHERFTPTIKEGPSAFATYKRRRKKFIRGGQVTSKSGITILL